ncbi:hypothetical protein F7731_10635 [Cytobacillus depressus]|uniref:Flagellar hook-length control protein FliK n=1 Tax=Cytobacillus depressus TaxID=1602942 RepID=A0A6L3V872_9BACI|nr:hypothetical protein [Cytobacillus depressus]KAB2336797.1 hypothetical protein F7731_10635 [Cytobacillus depressus]
MQVNNLFMGLPLQINDSTSSFRAGEVVQAVIKERLDQNQATVMMKGQEFTAKFEGNIPPTDRFFVSVVRFDENGQVIIKPSSAPPANNSINDMLKMGVDPASHPELRESIQFLTNKGYRLDKEAIANLKQFLEKSPGSFEDKLKTIQGLAQRKLEITVAHLSAVHSALNGKGAVSLLFNSFQDLLEELGQFHSDQGINLLQASESIIDSRGLDVQVESNDLASSNNMKTEIANENIEEPSQLQKGDTLIDERPIMDEVAQTLNLASKNILVTEITKKLSQMTINFNTMKRDAVKFLDHINHTFVENKPIPAAQVKQLLESAINKLDNAILKGDYMLYTDMGTEKELLSASSQLAKARDLIAKGSHTEANQIVKEVKALLDTIHFKPAVSKVMHFVSEQSLLQKEMNASRPLINELQQVMKPIFEQENSARHMFETVKRMGLVHENQTANVLIGNSKGETEPNLKSALMKLIQLEEGQPRTVQPLEQALTNLTGQQLLNKPDSSGMQNLFMQLPLMLENKMENVKVFVNSQKKGKGIDWENCSLYFVLETKKLGEIGILVNANNRNLSITLKTNRQGLAAKAEKFMDASIDRLNEIGYKVGTIHFKPFGDQVEENKIMTAPKVETQTSLERGYDFKV